VGGYALGVNQRLRRFIVVYAGDCFMWSEEAICIVCGKKYVEHNVTIIPVCSKCTEKVIGYVWGKYRKVFDVGR